MNCPKCNRLMSEMLYSWECVHKPCANYHISFKKHCPLHMGQALNELGKCAICEDKILNHYSPPWLDGDEYHCANHDYYLGNCKECIEGEKTRLKSKSVEQDPNGIAQHESGAKLDSGKIRSWLCLSGFANAMGKIAEVTTVGATKYTPNGWQAVPDGQERYMDAFARHMLKLGQGETIDPDTKCLHKAQMIWNLLASLELELRNGR